MLGGIWFEIVIRIRCNQHEDAGERMQLLRVYHRLSKDIAHIERQLRASMDTEPSVLYDASAHLLMAGGKRLRPILVLLCGQFGTYDVERLAHIAVPLELIHMATLVHDDVIDQANTRRGKPTVRAQWGSRIAMYTGDYIFGRALSIAMHVQMHTVHHTLSKAMVQMVIGEIAQLRSFYVLEQTVRDYLLRIRRKTSLLIATSCQLGALVAGASEAVAQRLYTFGYNMGMAFQIRDDMLDLIGTSKQLGKPPGSDIRQGNVTLPILYAIQQPHIREAVMEVFHLRDAVPHHMLENTLAMIRHSEGMKRADALAHRFIARAIAALDPLPAITAKADLLTMARMMTDRAY